MSNPTKNSYLQDVSTLSLGTLISQLIPLILSPYLARVFTPEDFGIFGVFFALTAVFGVSSAAKYDIATLIPRKDKHAVNLAIIALFFCFLTSFLLAIFLIFYEYFDNNNTIINNSYYLWIIGLPAAVLFTGIFNVLNYLNTRFENYNDIAKAKIYKSAALSFSQIFFGAYSFGALGLCLGLIISNIFANFKLAKNIIINKIYNKTISIDKIKELTYEYRIYPLSVNPSSFVNSITTYMPLFFIIKISGEAISGSFFFATRLISIPSALIGKAISQVFFQKISSLKANKKKCKPIFFQTVKSLILIALPFTLVTFSFAPMIFELIFGPQWIEAGIIAKYLGLIFFIQFITSTVSNVLSIKEFVYRDVGWKMLYFFTTLVFYISVLAFQINFYTFIKLFVVHQYILYSIYMFLIVRSINEIDKEF
jgi:O-antigen/teichoic acid export membrane protein